MSAQGHASTQHDPAQWFSGEGGTPFLAHVRRIAPERLGGLIPSAQTWARIDLGGSLLAVDVPDVPDGELSVINNHIQVLWDEHALGGYWGCSHIWDDFDERDPEALVVRDESIEDEEAAQKAVAWLAHQLSRPLDFQVWKRGNRVLARQWVLSDTGRVIGARGSWLFQRGAPTEVTRLRPGSE